MAYWWWRTPRVKTTYLIYSIRRVSRQVIIKDFTAKIAVSYYNTVVFTFLRGHSRVHRKPKSDTHRHFCLTFGNIGILTSLSTLILKIIVAKLSSCAKVEFDVIVQMRSFLSFNNSKFKRDILRISDCFYAAYINIQPSRDTWPHPLTEKSPYHLNIYHIGSLYTRA